MEIRNKINEHQIIRDAFPADIHQEVNNLFLKLNIETAHSTNAFEPVFLQKESINIPTRIYYTPPPLSQAKYTSMEKDIINCIFSRHHNGYIRQQAIQNIISSDNYWTTPYIMRIVGEYVMEILLDIYNRFDEINKPNLMLFIRENPLFYARIRARVYSYWNCYYRHQFPKKLKGVTVPEEKQYIGFRLLNKIDKLLI